MLGTVEGGSPLCSELPKSRLTLDSCLQEVPTMVSYGLQGVGPGSVLVWECLQCPVDLEARCYNVLLLQEIWWVVLKFLCMGSPSPPSPWLLHPLGSLCQHRKLQ